MKKLLLLVTSAVAMVGCGNVTGPQSADEQAKTAKSSQILAHASGQKGPSTRLSAN